MALLLILVAAGPARAWVRSTVPGASTCLYWSDRTVGWSLHEDGARGLGFELTREVMRRSFSAWSELSCTDLAFVEGAPLGTPSVSASSDSSSNVNQIVFRPDLCEDVVPSGDRCWDEGTCGNAFHCFAYGDGVIAITTTSFLADSGEILDADIEFNEGAFHFTAVDGGPCSPGEVEGCVSTDLQNTATHEIGHMVGLDHTRIRSATMFGSAPAGETEKRTLDQDDAEGLCAIYPLGQPPTACSDTGELVNTQSGCNCGGAGSGASLVGLLLGALALRRMLGRSV